MIEMMKQCSLMLAALSLSVFAVGCGATDEVVDVIETENGVAGVSGTCYGPCKSAGLLDANGQAKPACTENGNGGCDMDSSNCTSEGTNATCACHTSTKNGQDICLCATGAKML